MAGCRCRVKYAGKLLTLHDVGERELGDSFIASKSFSASNGFARTRRPHRMSLQSGNNLGCQYHSTVCGQACIIVLLSVAPLLLRCSFRGASSFRRVRGQHGCSYPRQIRSH